MGLLGNFPEKDLSSGLSKRVLSKLYEVRMENLSPPMVPSKEFLSLSRSNRSNSPQFLLKEVENE